MKKILILFLFPLICFGQSIKVKDLPTTTTGASGDYFIKDDAAGTSGSTKKISAANIISTYSLVTSVKAGSGISVTGSSPTYTVSTLTTVTTGTFTPTFTIISNLSGIVNVGVSYYTRVGNTITVTGQLAIGGSTTVDTEFLSTVPINNVLNSKAMGLINMKPSAVGIILGYDATHVSIQSILVNSTESATYTYTYITP